MTDTPIPIRVTGRFPRLASFRDEWDLDLEDPEAAIRLVRQDKGIKADVFTFWQRPPFREPRYVYFMEKDGIAVLEYLNYKHWWERILDDKSRNMVRKAGKKGVIVREAVFDDDFVKGIVDIYHETPTRQGRPFPHFGDTFEQVKRANGENVERSEFVGAYHEGRLIGFLKLVYGHRTGRTEQILSLHRERDKAPTNALIAKAVELCERRQIPYLVYAKWPRGTLAAFKKNNGFVRYELPRYYVPLNAFGALAIKARLYRGIDRLLPEKLTDALIGFRTKWYRRRHAK